MGHGEWPNFKNKYLERALHNLFALQFDSENNLKVRTQTVKAAIWDTTTDFHKGTHTDTESSGSGENQLLRPVDLDNLDENIPFTTAGNYTLSDAAKLEISGGKLQHKAVSGNTQTSPFTTSGNYTISDADKLEITGGVAKLKDSGDSYPSDVLGHWKLNESTGSSAADSTGNGHTGTLVNMENADWVSAKLNNGLIFDGSNEYINAGTSADFEFETTDAFSVEFWLKTTETASNAFLVSRNQASSPNRGWTVTMGNTGTGLVALVMKDDNDDFIKRIGDTNIADDAFHHVVVTYDGSTNRTGINIYVDGALETMADAGVASLSGSTAIGGGEFLAMMASNGLGSVNFCAGTLDNVLIYNRELSSSEVSARYNSAAGLENLYDITDPTVIRSTGLSFTTALESFTETATTPTDTSIRYHVSSDDGSTWKYWTGSAWAVTDGTYAQANSAADVNTNIGTLASSGTFKFRALLRSSTGISTPELDEIVVSEPITYSTDDDLYADTKDASQIDTSDVVAFLRFIDTVTTPSGVDIRVMFSNDGRSSWLTWTGSAWAAPTSATDRTEATSLSDADTNIPTLPVGSNDTLDVRVFVYTSDSSNQGQVDNFNITADKSLAINSSWESNIFDSGVHEQDWGKISFETTLPNGTSVTVKAKASSLSAVDLSGVAWSSALSNNEETNLIGRYMQVQVTFVATSTTRPTMDSVRVQYVTPDIQLVKP